MSTQRGRRRRVADPVSAPWHLRPERAATTTNQNPPIRWFELASKHDLVELEGRIDGKLARLESSLTGAFVTWLLASQAAMITVMVGLPLALR